MGRMAVYMVMGMSAIFMFFGKNMSEVGTQAVSNSIDYFENTQRYNIAVAGANLACNQIFLDNTWRDGFTDMEFNGGIINVTLYDSASGKVLMTSIGTYQGTTQQVRVLLSPSAISKFAMYSGNVSAAAKLRSGDTVDGPIHFNNKLATQGNPVFMHKATMGSLQTTAGTPTFLGGYQTGVNIDFPDMSPSVTNIKTAANAAGKYVNGSNLWLKFLSDGTVQYKSNSGDAWSAAVSLATYAPNGYICVNDGQLHIEGTVKGKVTLASTVTDGVTPSSTKGITMIEGDFKYATDPLTNPASTDMAGIVSAGNLQINVLPIRMDGAYFADKNATLGSGLTNTNPAKQMKIVGSFITREINSTDFGTGANKGANFYMKYDTRIEDNPPNDFPFVKTNSFEVLSWFE